LRLRSLPRRRRAEQGKSSGNTGSQRACHARRDSSGKASGIREALESLRRAKAHMEHAAHDFGGHRVEAIEATNQAIKQLEFVLKFDRTKRKQTTQRS